MKHPVARYLMSAYAYYELDDPLMTDGQFDKLGTWLLTHYDDIDHQHKSLITKDDLKAGTYLGKYPEMVKGAVDSWNKTYTKGQARTMIKNHFTRDRNYLKQKTLEDFF